MASVAAVSGSDPILGEFEGIAYDGAADGLTIKHYTRMDVFTFSIPAGPKAATIGAFPSFSLGATAAATVLNSCVSFAHTNFLAGGYQNELSKCGTSDGPMLLVSNSSADLSAVVLSAASHFTSFHPTVAANKLGGGTLAMSAVPTNAPAGSVFTSVLVARPHVTRAYQAWGSFQRQLHNTVRARGSGVGQLSYWDDNEAGYSYWSAAKNLNQWGVPEDIFLQLIKSYHQQGVPIAAFEVDCNFEYEIWWPTYGGWCWSDWSQWNATAFPSGGNLSAKLGGMPMTYYVSPFCNDTVHRKDHTFVDAPVGGKMMAIAAPNASYGFYKEILSKGVKDWNMEMLFTDFMSDRGDALQRAIPAHFEAAHEWMEGMITAASELGLESQICMANPSQALDTLLMGSVTNARISGDGGMKTDALPVSASLAAVVGLGWSKDNLQIGGKWTTSALQATLAALSLGPVGLADRLDNFPHPPTATSTVSTNVTLATALATANGTLLQPSVPLQPIAELLVNRPPLGNHMGHVWTTHTTVPLLASSGDSSGSSSAAIFFTALGFGDRGFNSTMFALGPDTLGRSVDFSSPSPPDFSQIPGGSFSGDGGTGLNGGSYVWFRPASLVKQASYGDWSSFALTMAKPASLAMVEGVPDLLHASPVLGGIALLGEATKIAAIASYRFASVQPASSGSGLTVSLRGAPKEVVTLLYSEGAAGSTIKSKTVTLGSDGTGSALLS